jgi:hypothetical protein
MEQQDAALMNRWLLALLCFACLSGQVLSESNSRRIGRVIEVTRLDDDVDQPRPGMLRWALQQAGPRVVQFKVCGTITLRDQIRVEHGCLTVDGYDAPGMGVCIRGGALEFLGVNDITIRYVRIRLGDKTTRRINREEKRERPNGSGGLDCLNFVNCHRVRIDHVSASWSCDEIVSVVHCRDVLIEWCLFAEPLADPPLHPYGDRHAYLVIASASTFTMRNCLLAHYVMRGPQFEANDMRRADDFAVRLVAEKNVMFDYERSGVRYTTGPEDHRDEAEDKQFDFRFLDNIFIPTKRSGPEMEAVTKHGVSSRVRVLADGNVTKRGIEFTPATVSIDAKGQLSEAAVAVKWQITVRPETRSIAKEELLAQVLAGAGCSHRRDRYDSLMVRDVIRLREREPIRSTFWRGGWPDLKTRAEPLARQLFRVR